MLEKTKWQSMSAFIVSICLIFEFHPCFQVCCLITQSHHSQIAPTRSAVLWVQCCPGGSTSIMGSGFASGCPRGFWWYAGLSASSYLRLRARLSNKWCRYWHSIYVGIEPPPRSLFCHRIPTFLSVSSNPCSLSFIHCALVPRWTGEIGPAPCIQ